MSGTWAYCGWDSTLSVLSFLPPSSFLLFIILFPFFFPPNADIGPHGHCLIQAMVQEILSLIKVNRKRLSWVSHAEFTEQPKKKLWGCLNNLQETHSCWRSLLFGEVILIKEGIWDYFIKNWFGFKRKRLPKQYLLMKSQNDSTSGMSFIFLYFGKKFDSQLGIQPLYPSRARW